MNSKGKKLLRRNDESKSDTNYTPGANHLFMATHVFDERRFSSQCSLYDSPSERASNSANSASTLNLSSTSRTTNRTNLRRVTMTSQTSVAFTHRPSTNSTQRASTTNDLISVLRSFALKPFKTSSIVNHVHEGQTNVGSLASENLQPKSSVSLLRYRPLSDSVTDHACHAQFNHVRMI